MQSPIYDKCVYCILPTGTQPNVAEQCGIRDGRGSQSCVSPESSVVAWDSNKYILNIALTLLSLILVAVVVLGESELTSKSLARTRC
jgi:hypothetical protein